jgi:membrane dipeptidase
MRRGRLRAALLAAALGGLCACTAQPEPEASATGRAEALARQFPIVDTHIDLPDRLRRAPEDITVSTARGDFDYPRAVRGGLDALFMSIYIPADVDAAGQSQALADELIAGVERLAAEHPDKFALATCAADVPAASATGRIALAMAIENGGPIAGELDNVARYRAKGIVAIGLAHSKSNHIADSSYDPDERWGGLSDFGKSLIPAMNEHGVIIDVSHISDRAFWQVLALSRAPVIASHSSLRHFTPGFHRNMDDAMVKALGEQGGVIQINFGSLFLTDAARRYSDARQAAFLAFREQSGLAPDHPDILDFSNRYRAEHPYPYATIEDVLDHIDRAVELAGIDHVGIGSDFEGVGDTLPAGLKDVSDYPNLVAGLLRRGYRDEDIGKILGGNTLRVWRAVEAYAATRGHPAICQS